MNINEDVAKCEEFLEVIGNFVDSDVYWELRKYIDGMWQTIDFQSFVQYFYDTTIDHANGMLT